MAAWAGPTIEKHIRSGPANSTHASMASASAFTGTRLAPAWQSERSIPSRSKPHTGHPRLPASRPALWIRELTNTFSTGWVASTRMAAGRSPRSRTRTPGGGRRANAPTR